MAKLITTGSVSLDGYVNDTAGKFDWAAPDEEVHAAVNDLERSVGTHLYGRRMYEVMTFWEGAAEDDALPKVARDWADIWMGVDKIVYSSSLDAATTKRTKLESRFDAKAVRAMVDEAKRDVSIGGPTLAAHAWRAGILDEVRVLTHPVVVGGGTSFFPKGLNELARLALVEERRFSSGVVLARYEVKR